MPSFACRAIAGEPIEVYGDGSQVMDMIYVEDVARIMVSALEELDSGGRFETIEAGTGVDTTVADIAEQVATAVLALTGQTVTVVNLPMRPGEDPNSVVLGDPATLLQLGIKSEELTQLPAGTHKTVAYFWDYMQGQLDRLNSQ
jgi:UDP-glucose 4-epimerase